MSALCAEDLAHRLRLHGGSWERLAVALLELACPVCGEPTPCWLHRGERGLRAATDAEIRRVCAWMDGVEDPREWTTLELVRAAISAMQDGDLPAIRLALIVRLAERRTARWSREAA